MNLTSYNFQRLIKDSLTYRNFIYSPRVKLVRAREKLHGTERLIHGEVILYSIRTYYVQ